MKKILFISPTGTFDNGAEISIFSLMKYLVNLGDEVYAVAPQHFRPAQTDYFNLCREAGIYVHFIPSLKWWWEDAPGGLAGTHEERIYFYKKNILDIQQFIQTKSIDLVITNTVNIFQGAVAAAIENVPHYWLIHEFPKNEFAYYLSKTKFIDCNSEAIYGVSGELQRELKKMFPNRIVKSFTPYTKLKIAKLKNGDNIRIVSIGRITKGKNQLELIKAFSLLDGNTKLIFIGDWDSEYKKECDDWICEHHVKNIEFIGNRENPWDLITEKDICVLTSSMETFGLVYVEALLQGVPVIISDNLGFKSVYEIFKFGTMYSLGEIEKLSGTISKYMENFIQIKKESIDFIPKALSLYDVASSYKELILDIDNILPYKKKGISSLNYLLITNKEENKLKKVLKRVFRKIKSKTCNL
ncbi:glycosyltransferase family 4 protein [Enterococcus nangangensis]|uniref:glycosyltransferase family 4 protein n=1 Tax=Enterococcus nangangensis TaxID=2559926 RepID=UPI0010F477A5|nr:glycosyltransferase family 4 protein [Enterococcus nangangensis]